MYPDKTKFPLWMKIAYSQLGEKEKPRGDNGAIQLMFKLVGSSERRDEVPWCSAKVGAALARCGIKGTSSLMARSWLAWGKPLREPEVGAIVIFPRGKNPELGHVGFVYRWTEKSVWVLGGNQSNTVSIKRFDRSKVLSYRWPMETAQIGINFDRALSFVLRDDIEGGWTDHPEDNGGATMRGVTIGRYSEFLGRKATKEELRNITNAEIRTIYMIYYWFESFADLIPAPLSIVHFGAAVNHGPADAARFLQQAVGATVDGDIGPKTLARVTSQHRTALPKYFDIREADYRSLGDFKHFGRGWLNRLSKLRHYVRQFDWPPRTEHSVEKSPVSKSEKFTMPEAPKWWLYSKTVWGSIIAFLSYTLPVFAAVMGWPITGDDIVLIDKVGISLIETIGVTIGALLSIYGRFKAEAPVERKPVTFAF